MSSERIEAAPVEGSPVIVYSCGGRCHLSNSSVRNWTGELGLKPGCNLLMISNHLAASVVWIASCSKRRPSSIRIPMRRMPAQMSWTLASVLYRCSWSRSMACCLNEGTMRAVTATSVAQ